MHSLTLCKSQYVLYKTKMSIIRKFRACHVEIKLTVTHLTSLKHAILTLKLQLVLCYYIGIRLILLWYYFDISCWYHFGVALILLLQLAHHYDVIPLTPKGLKSQSMIFGILGRLLSRQKHLWFSKKNCKVEECTTFEVK